MALSDKMMDLQQWIDKFKLSHVDLFIQIFTGIRTETYSNQRPIIAAFSYIENNIHQIFIIHISKPYSFQLFSDIRFQPLKQVLEDKHICKYVYDNEKGNEIAQVFLNYFQILVNGMKAIVTNQKPWKEILNGPQLRRKFDKMKADKPNIFSECVENLSFSMTNEQYLTNSEKHLYYDVITSIFELFSELVSPEKTNPHVIMPSNRNLYQSYLPPQQNQKPVYNAPHPPPQHPLPPPQYNYQGQQPPLPHPPHYPFPPNQYPPPQPPQYYQPPNFQQPNYPQNYPPYPRAPPGPPPYQNRPQQQFHGPRNGHYPPLPHNNN